MRTGLFAIICILFMTLAFACSSARQPPSTTPAPTSQPIAWQPWSDDQFAQATREHKFVLLDLEAVWCHWCHVQDEITYQDPQVRRLIHDKYIAVKVDQDSRPDISNRYEDYGWPATVVFNENGGEIVKRRGYLPPKGMAAILQAIIDDPTPGPSIEKQISVEPAINAALSSDLRKKMEANLVSLYDSKAQGWWGSLKFVDPETIEYCMTQSEHGNKTLDQMARQTLTAGLKLVDPAWGGVYQYSTDSDWDHPHFEKIMSYQAGDLQTYARAYLLWKDPAYLQAARSIQQFLSTFLWSRQGAFYTSQDADLIPGEHSGEYFKLNDAGRRKLGIPKIDKHIYARENGWAIASFCAYYGATDDADALAKAKQAADWILANRALPGGGFRHDEKDPAGPFLGDTLAMGRAFLSLYEVTGDRIWLMRANDAAGFIEKTFVPATGAGIATAVVTNRDLPPLKPEVDENVTVARFGRLLFQYTGNPAHEKLAETAMRYVASPEIAGARRWMGGGILLADQELSSDPVHVTVVGPKSDDRARTLFMTAMKVPISYYRLEWFDSAEGPLPRAEVEFPPLKIPAAFLCSGTACSSPMRDATALWAKLEQAIHK